MSEHTPGPWRAEGLAVVWDAPESNNTWIVADLSGNIPAPQHRWVSEEIIANARLIAAAPELLAALNEFAKLGPFAGTRAWGKAQKTALAALTKAEGREQ